MRRIYFEWGEITFRIEITHHSDDMGGGGALDEGEGARGRGR